MYAVVAFNQKGYRSKVGTQDLTLAERLFRKVGEIYNKVYLLDMLNVKMPPLGYKHNHRKHLFWCTLCGKERRFISNGLDERCCPVCRLSTADFNIKTANHLWAEGVKIEGRKKK